MMSRTVTRLVLGPVAACAARCGRMLGALSRLGRRRLGGSKPGAAAVTASASVFTRVARAMRLITLLELRIRALLARGPVAAAPAEAAPSETERLQDPKDRDPVERPERLEDQERPDREHFPKFDLDKLIFEDARPLTEIVAAVCRDLGLGREATLRAQAPFAELEALLAGKPSPQPASAPSMDRARPRALFLGTAEPPDAKRARVDARGPEKPSRAADRPQLSKRARRRLRGRPP